MQVIAAVFDSTNYRKFCDLIYFRNLSMTCKDSRVTPVASEGIASADLLQPCDSGKKAHQVVEQHRSLAIFEFLAAT